jgi:enoyl-[acyl-carrier-protein] reductase (NADH)
MPTRLAAAMSLIVFAVCLVMGIEADNPFSTTIERAMEGMGATLIVGMVVGAMGQKMIEESVNREEKTEVPEAKAKAKGR